MCEGASKQFPDLKNFTRRDRAPGSKNPGPATVACEPPIVNVLRSWSADPTCMYMYNLHSFL